MSDFTVRSDSIDVEQIMQRIRARIREKRGVDYTEEEIVELASVKLDRFLDPKQLRSGLVEQFRKARESASPETSDFEDTSIYESHRFPFVTTIRRLLNPVLRLFFNPHSLIQALQVNRRWAARESLHYEVMSNLVLELTRLSVEVKNLRMHVESLSARLDFDERRARALEGVVQLKPGALSPDLSTLGPERAPAGGGEAGEGDAGSRAARRRRRRRRRRPGGTGDEAGIGVGGGAAEAGKAFSPDAGASDQLDRDDDGPDAESSRGEDSSGQ